MSKKSPNTDSVVFLTLFRVIWDFGYFLFFLLGGGTRGIRGAGRGGGDFLNGKSQEGGFSVGGGGGCEGPGGCLWGNLGGGG